MIALFIIAYVVLGIISMLAVEVYALYVMESINIIDSDDTFNEELCIRIESAMIGICEVEGYEIYNCILELAKWLIWPIHSIRMFMIFKRFNDECKINDYTEN